MKTVKYFLASLVLASLAVLSLGMGGPPSDEMLFKGTSDVMKPTQTITSLVKITKSNQNVYPKCGKDGSVVFQSYATEKKLDAEGKEITAGSFNVLITNGNFFRLVTNDKNNNENPCFVNENKVIFNSDRLGSEKIWIADASGKGGIIQLTSSSLNDLMPDVSSDGTKVVYNSFKNYTTNLALTGYGARWQVWSLLSEMPSIWMVDIDGRNLTQFFEGIKPAWSPDGKKIAYYKLTGGYYQIWIMDSDGANQTQITTGDYNSLEPAWAPDGKTIVFVTNSAKNYDIWSIKTDGTELTQLTVQDCYDGAPACSVDGKYIYFHSFLGGSWNIWRMELARPFVVPVVIQPVIPEVKMTTAEGEMSAIEKSEQEYTPVIEKPKVNTKVVIKKKLKKKR